MASEFGFSPMSVDTPADPFKLTVVGAVLHGPHQRIAPPAQQRFRSAPLPSLSRPTATPTELPPSTPISCNVFYVVPPIAPPKASSDRFRHRYDGDRLTGRITSSTP
ncbi:hypothetical protein ACHAW6_016041 [Cyclotella cf. meneghiniana]